MFAATFLLRESELLSPVKSSLIESSFLNIILQTQTAAATHGMISIV